MVIIISHSTDSFEDSFKILCKDDPTFNSLLATRFSIPNPSAFFVQQYGYNVPSRLYGVNQFGYFKHGLIFEVLSYIKLNYPNAEIRLSNTVKDIIKKRLPLREFVNSDDYKGFMNIAEGIIEPRSYQPLAVSAVIEQGYGRCMFECPTGSGKSFIIANLIYTLKNQYNPNLRTLLFLPNAQLVSQFEQDLKDYGYPASALIAYTPKTIKKYKKEDLLNAEIIISNRQFLFNHIKKLGNFDLLIVDEVHSCAPGSKTSKLLDSINIPLKVGCSGTIPTAKDKYWSLLNTFGPVVFRESITNLQAQGFLSNVKFILVNVKDAVVAEDRSLLFHTKAKIKYSPDDDTEIAFNAAYNAEVEYMSEHCMSLYSPVLTSLNLPTTNTLVLFDRIEFGRALFKFLSETKFNNFSHIYYIDGSIPILEREEIRAKCEHIDTSVLIVAQVSTMSVGINIKNLSNLIMTGSNKSHTRTLQAIGRLLRLHTRKDFAYIYDIVFTDFKYSKRHYRERKSLYKQYYDKDKPHETINITINER